MVGGINRGARKLTRIPILKKKLDNLFVFVVVDPLLFSTKFLFLFSCILLLLLILYSFFNILSRWLFICTPFFFFFVFVFFDNPGCPGQLTCIIINFQIHRISNNFSKYVKYHKNDNHTCKNSKSKHINKAKPNKTT